MGKLKPNHQRKVVTTVVKGITRQVILVKSPDPRLFEEAIFIVKEEALNREGVTTEQIMHRAISQVSRFFLLTKKLVLFLVLEMEIVVMT